MKDKMKKSGSKDKMKKSGSRSVAPLIEAFYPEYYGLHSYPAEQCAPIRKTSEKWGVFCNFWRGADDKHKSPLVVNGVPFSCVEKLYQMMKFKDAAIINELYGVEGMTIKMKTKKYDPVCRRADWGPMVLDAMKFCLMVKYEQIPAFRAALAETKERGLFIVEDETARKRGAKPADSWGTKLVDGQYVGPSLLGVLLMELRDNGQLEYKLPADALDFIKLIKSGK